MQDTLTFLVCDGPKGVEALAEETKTHAPTLYRILRALASVGVFVETEGHVFGLTPLAQCLFSNSLRPIARMFLSQWHDKAWNGLSHTVKTGEPGLQRQIWAIAAKPFPVILTWRDHRFVMHIFWGFENSLLIDGREKNSNGIHDIADTYRRGPIDLLRNEPKLNIRSSMNITL